MGLGGALFALTAVQAVSQISQGYAQKAESSVNASLLTGKADLIDVQKDIEHGRYESLKGQHISQSMAGIAKAGIMPQGSAMAFMLESQRQISIDQAISDFNYTAEKNYTMAEADAHRRAGSAAVQSGYAGAFSSLLTGASNYAMYKMARNTTFDSNTSLPSRVAGFGGGTKPYTPPRF